MLTTILIILLLVVLVSLNFAKQKRRQHLLDAFEGPPHYPIIGHVNFSRLSEKKFFNEIISEWIYTYPTPFAIYLVFRPPLVFIHDPENFQIVANKTLEKGSDYEFIKRFYGNGLATINETDLWKKRRRILLPSVSLKMMGPYYLEIFNRLNKELVKEFEQHADTDKEISLWLLIHSNICSAFFASFMKYTKRDESDIRLADLGHALPRGLKYVTQRVYFPWLHTNIGNKLWEWISGRKRTLQYFDDSKRKISDKLRERLKGCVRDSTATEKLSSKTFIDILCSKEASKLYPYEEIMEEIITFMIGTTETSAINICFTLLMLAIHQDSQEKVFKEIKSVLPHNKTPTLDELGQLVYLEQCINETLRLYPSIPWIVRSTTKDLTLKDGRILPAGCDAVLAIIGIHRNSNIYKNPTLWEPNRFLPEEVAKRHPCAFVPFSVGPRNCPAAKIGLLSIKSQLVSLIQEYKFMTNMKLTDIELNFDVDLRNESGFRVYVQKR